MIHRWDRGTCGHLLPGVAHGALSVPLWGCGFWHPELVWTLAFITQILSTVQMGKWSQPLP